VAGGRILLLFIEEWKDSKFVLLDLEAGFSSRRQRNTEQPLEGGNRRPATSDTTTLNAVHFFLRASLFPFSDAKGAFGFLYF